MKTPAAILLAASLAAPAMGQSLLRRPIPQAPDAPPSTRAPSASPGMMAPDPNQPPTTAPSPTASASSQSYGSLTMRNASLIMVEAPKPKVWAVHDQITIIISESSTQSSQQKLDAKKDASLKAAVNSFPDLQKFLEANLTNTGAGQIASVDTTGSSNYKGDGKFERTDKFQDRIQATIIDVKPNGVMVVEARKTVGQDKELRTLVLSGECRREDVTDNNTILSGQLADLTILAHAEGDTKDTATKGFLTRLVDTIFNF